MYSESESESPNACTAQIEDANEGESDDGKDDRRTMASHFRRTATHEEEEELSPKRKVHSWRSGAVQSNSHLSI